jgi:hypothetical protein
MESDFQLSHILLNNLNLLNQVYTTKFIKEYFISKFGNNNNKNIVLPNNLRTIIGISKEVKSIDINTLISIIKMNHIIPIIKPKCIFLEYNQEPEFVYNI